MISGLKFSCDTVDSLSLDIYIYIFFFFLRFFLTVCKRRVDVDFGK